MTLRWLSEDHCLEAVARCARRSRNHIKYISVRSIRERQTFPRPTRAVSNSSTAVAPRDFRPIRAWSLCCTAVSTPIGLRQTAMKLDFPCIRENTGRFHKYGPGKNAEKRLGVRYLRSTGPLPSSQSRDINTIASTYGSPHQLHAFQKLPLETRRLVYKNHIRPTGQIMASHRPWPPQSILLGEE
jgi:hypothetical protein